MSQNRERRKTQKGAPSGNQGKGEFADHNLDEQVPEIRGTCDAIDEALRSVDQPKPAVQKVDIEITGGRCGCFG